jgi:predicted nucleic acid-binding Zn ribbon protein
VSLSSFQLKGSGWYATDYGGKKAPTGERKKDDKPPETAKSDPPSKTKTEE